MKDNEERRWPPGSSGAERRDAAGAAETGLPHEDGYPKKPPGGSEGDFKGWKKEN